MISFKKIITLGLVAIGVTATASLFSANGNPLAGVFGATEGDTVITVDKSVTSSTSFTKVDYKYNNDVTLTFSHVKKGGTVGEIAPFSTVTKVDASYGIKTIKVNFSSGSINVLTWYNQNDVVKHAYIGNHKPHVENDISSGELLNVSGNYFSIEAGKYGCVIDSIELTFNKVACVAKAPATRPSAGTVSNFSMWTAYFMPDTTNGRYYYELELNDVVCSGNFFLPEPGDSFKIYDGSTIAKIYEVRMYNTNRILIRLNLKDVNTGGNAFYPHIKVGSVDWDVRTNHVHNSDYSYFVNPNAYQAEAWKVFIKYKDGNFNFCGFFSYGLTCFATYTTWVNENNWGQYL